MNELQLFSELHKFLNGLGAMKCMLPTKSLSLGYVPLRFGRQYSKFATLYGEKRYNCLIIHVDPGNPESGKGKIIQNEIQAIFHFEIKEIRRFSLKKHEVYIPFEVIDSEEKLKQLKEFVRQQYGIFLSK